MRYIIDSRYFDGTCLTSMSDDMHSDYGGETLEALREREKNPYLVAVSPVRMTLLVKRYTRALCKRSILKPPQAFQNKHTFS